MTEHTSETVLVVAAHPDDESLGCGGTIARHTASGDQVHVMFIADGVTARHDDIGSETALSGIEAREKMARKAANVLGTEEPRFERLHDNRLDQIPLLDIIRKIEKLVSELRPDTVYTHHRGDLNIDHRIVHQAVATACRPLPGAAVRAIYAWETVSSTEWSSPGHDEVFVPNHFVDIGDTLETKLEAVQCYEGELQPSPHSRSEPAIRALARWRGSSVGLEAAEAFTLVRRIV